MLTPSETIQTFDHKGKSIRVVTYRRPTHWMAMMKERGEGDRLFRTVHVLHAKSKEKLAAEVTEWLDWQYNIKPPVPQIPADLAYLLSAPIRPTGDYRIMVVDHPIG